MASRFFRADPDAYESNRLALDAAQQLPPGETTYTPLEFAHRDSDGNPVLSIRVMHCDRQPYKGAIEAALASGDMVEITEEDYRAAMPAE